jgi:hypothetical protein
VEKEERAIEIRTLLGNLKGKAHLGDLRVDGIILKKQDMRVWT